MTAIEFMEQMIGFFIQVFPTSILCLIPFDSSSLRLSKRKTYLITTIMMSVFSILFAILSWLIYTPTTDHNTFLRNTANIYLMFCILVWIVFFSHIVKSTKTRKILILGLMIHYAAIIFTVCSILGGYLCSYEVERAQPLLVYVDINLVLNIVLFLLSAPLMYLFLTRMIHPSLKYMNHTLLKRSCIYVITAFMLFCTCIYALNSLQFYYGFTGIGIIILITSFVLTDGILYFMLFYQVKLTAQNLTLETQIRSFEEQYRQITANINEVRRARHDIRHHLNALSTMNAQSDYDGLTAYLENYSSFYEELENVPLCHYPVLDNLLQYYISKAKEQDISVTTKFGAISESIHIDTLDLTVLLGNLLENAIEHSSYSTQEQMTFLRIWIKQNEQSLLIRIENSCEYDRRDTDHFSDGHTFLTKKDPRLHGYGLNSIRLVAKKYSGSVETKKYNGIFTIRIVLNV